MRRSAPSVSPLYFPRSKSLMTLGLNPIRRAAAPCVIGFPPSLVLSNQNCRSSSSAARWSLSIGCPSVSIR